MLAQKTSHAKHWWRAIRLWMIFAVTIAIACLVDYFIQGPITQLDFRVNEWVSQQQAEGMPMHDIGDTISWLGDPFVDAAVTLFAVLVLLSWGDSSRAGVAVGAQLVNVAVILGLKHTLSRPLPPESWDYGMGDFALPSGHTMGATVTAGILAFVLLESYIEMKRIRGPQATAYRALAIVGWVAVAFFTGMARVMDQTHWVNDVFLAWALGAFLVASMVLILEGYKVSKQHPAKVAVEALREA